MASGHGLGDRRATVRFEIGGRLWGTLETMDPLPMRNIGRGGVLVESPAPMKVDSFHRIHLLLPDHESVAEGRVRHVTSIHDTAGGSRYLVGFEFVTLEQSAIEQIDLLVASGGLPPGRTEVI